MSSSSVPTPRLITLSLAACLAAVAASFIIAVMIESSGGSNALVDDPNHYARISDAIVDGAVPYIDLSVEHLPGALVPMVATKLIVTVIPLRYFTVWVALMTACVVASAVLWRKVDLEFDAGMRFLTLSALLLPIVLFRVEPWVILLVTLAVVLAFESKWVGSSVAGVVATLSKGWPLVIFALPYQAGKRRIALAGASFSILILLWVTLQPGFREGRAFEGIHTETIVGSLLLMIRHVAGTDLGVVSHAGAAYVSTEWIAIAANAAIGVVFLAIAFVAVARTPVLPASLIPIGLAVLAIVVGSPLFSAQFVFWLVPFALFLGRTERRLFLVVALLTTLSVAGWAPLDLSWVATVVVRNVVLIALGVMWALSAMKPQPVRSHH